MATESVDLIPLLRELDENNITRDTFMSLCDEIGVDGVCMEYSLIPREVEALADYFANSPVRILESGPLEETQDSETIARAALEAQRALDAMRAEFDRKFPSLDLDQNAVDEAMARMGGHNPFL